MKKLNNRGFGVIEGLLFLAIIGIVVGMGFYVYNANKKTNDSLDNISKVPVSTKQDSQKNEKNTERYTNAEFG